jgi:hypothetical protein
LAAESISASLPPSRTIILIGDGEESIANSNSIELASVLVAVNDGVQAMCDSQHGRALELFSHHRLNERVSLVVNGSSCLSEINYTLNINHFCKLLLTSSSTSILGLRRSALAMQMS